MAPQLAIVVAVLEEEHVTRAAERPSAGQATKCSEYRGVRSLQTTVLGALIAVRANAETA